VHRPPQPRQWLQQRQQAPGYQRCLITTTATIDRPLLPPSRVTHRLSRVTHRLSRVTHRLSHVTHRLSRVTHRLSRVTHRLSRVTHRLSHVTHHLSSLPLRHPLRMI
jgi:DNA repair ATPase RecN